MPIRLTRRAACTLILTAQGLHRQPEGTATKNSVLEAIRRMGALQIDTINVVARSPYLVLWSRLGHYDPRWLDELLSDGALFEYWSHEACFLPIEDYRLYRHRMLEPSSLGWKYPQEWAAAHQKEIAQVLTGIRERGPLRSADFASNGKQKNGWGGWKPEKRALETLFTTGELMIARRHNFQRVYDLRERVLPTWDDTQLPPREEHATIPHPQSGSRPWRDNCGLGGRLFPHPQARHDSVGDTVSKGRSVINCAGRGMGQSSIPPP